MKKAGNSIPFFSEPRVMHRQSSKTRIISIGHQFLVSCGISTGRLARVGILSVLEYEFDAHKSALIKVSGYKEE